LSEFKKIREAKGYSQTQLAKATNLSVWTIRAFDQKTNDINKASFETILNLSLVLGTSMSSLLTDPNLIWKCKKAKL
jgi:transcriptional regulator with XRE-family HTH domain